MKTAFQKKLAPRFTKLFDVGYTITEDDAKKFNYGKYFKPFSVTRTFEQKPYRESIALAAIVPTDDFKKREDVREYYIELFDHFLDMGWGFVDFGRMLSTDVHWPIHILVKLYRNADDYKGPEMAALSITGWTLRKITAVTGHTFSKRLVNAIQIGRRAAPPLTLEMFKETSDKDWLSYPNLGKITLNEIHLVRQLLKAKGF